MLPFRAAGRQDFARHYRGFFLARLGLAAGFAAFAGSPRIVARTRAT
jgi:hypothetical protein